VVLTRRTWTVEGYEVRNFSAATNMRPTMVERPSEASDEELVRCIADGDEAALAAFYIRYRPLAFALAVRVVRDAGRAEDVLQDAFLSVWRKAATYTPSRGSARTWLSSIVRNRAIDLVRAARERTMHDDEELLLGLHDPEPPVFDQVAAALDGKKTRSVLRELPAEQREAISLAYFGGLSHSEIASRTGLPLGTVKSRVRLGIQRMRESMVVAAA
jgi:RNA polymerase sigma-70 factor (ECF subfamily)